MKKYWPGKVTFQVLPSALLNWDLGDNNEVDELALYTLEKVGGEFQTKGVKFVKD